jgi:hypothetical protein
MRDREAVAVEFLCEIGVLTRAEPDTTSSGMLFSRIKCALSSARG